MADETVEIKITGDSSDLVAAMNDVAKRVELLIDALSGTAQKFGEVGKGSEKAMGKVKKATDKAKKSIDQASEATEEYTKKTKMLGLEVGANRKNLEAVSDRMGRVDSSMQALATMSDHLSGSLAKTGKFMAENARLAGDAAAGMEQVILAATQAPGVFAIVTASVMALGAAYHFIQKPYEETIEKNEKLGKSWDRLGKKIAKQGKRIRDYKDQLKLLTGEEKEYDQQLRENIDALKSSEKQQKRAIDTLFREMKALDKSTEGRKEAERIREIGLKRLERSVDIERKLIQQLYEHTKAQHEAAEADKKRNSFLEKREIQAASWNDAMERQIQLGRDVVTSAADGAGAFKIYVKEMNKHERAADGSAGAMEKVAGMFKHSEREINLAAHSFVNAEKAANKSGTTTEKATKRAKDAIDLLNISARERLGIEEDLLVIAERGSSVYGAINKSTGETLNLYQVLNAALSAAVRRRQEEIAEQERINAASRAWVRERNSVLESLEAENAVIDATLKGPMQELQQSYQAQIDGLDKVIAKYQKSAENSKRSAAVIEAAEQKKELLTRVLAVETTELLDRENKQRENDRISSINEIEKAIRDIENISMGRVAETHKEKMKALEDFKQNQLDTLEELRKAAIKLGADEVEINRLVADEKSQIDAEYFQKRSDLEDQQSDAIKQKRLEDIQHFSDASSTLLQGTSDVLMAISQNVDDLTAEQKKKMFYLSQAAAIGEVAISGIVAIANIWEEHAANPVLAGALSAGMAGITAAQMSMLASEKPSFDIGGVIKGGVMAESPDQIGVNVLPGESVLNRAATERIGEQGVNALNSGGNMGQEIIVVPAYRHFDRFIKDEYRKGGAFRGFFNDAREYPVGQRSY
tara:strand:- start:10805 stop:13417 length:2613 start_codon:yes stop_codon:yes gene_type:complete